MSFSRNPIVTETVTAAVAIKFGQTVDFSGNLAAANSLVLGFAAYDAAVGDLFAVDVSGNLSAWAGAPIAAGQRLKADGLGNLVPVAVAADIGVAYALSAAATPGLPVRILRLAVSC